MRCVLKKPILGIMVKEATFEPPAAQKKFFAKLCSLGAEKGLIVYVFSPQHADRDHIRGLAYVPRTNGWQRGLFPLPDLIYDRAFCSDELSHQEHQAAIHKILLHKRIPYLGQGLKGKWDVHQAMSRDFLLRTFLPNTEQLHQMKSIYKHVVNKGSILLKPEYGTHGKGILVAHKKDGHYLLSGRDARNQIIAESFDHPLSMLRRIRGFIGSRRYLLQQYLPLKTKQGDSFDVRALMQKNGTGDWTLTGMVVRLGQVNSITANLHGGGTSAEITSFLNEQFGADQAKVLISTLTQVAIAIPPVLEQQFGRLAELGIDLGVDQNGGVWIIEANSKPGRSLFRPYESETTFHPAVSNPIAYAGYILQNQFLRNHLGRVT